MPLLGKAAVAMWWDVTLARRAEFDDWHSHEHFRERLGIPGFLRASRWASATGGDGYFVMYELDGLETLTSQRYLERLNDPSPSSRGMMPHHRNMVRSLCAIALTSGGGVARSMLTVRLSPRRAARSHCWIGCARCCRSSRCFPESPARTCCRRRLPRRGLR